MDESHATLPVPTRTRRGEREAEQTYTKEAAQVSGLLSCTICFFPLGHRRRLRPRLPQAHLARQRSRIGFPLAAPPNFGRPAIVLKYPPGSHLIRQGSPRVAKGRQGSPIFYRHRSSLLRRDGILHGPLCEAYGAVACSCEAYGACGGCVSRVQCKNISSNDATTAPATARQEGRRPRPRIATARRCPAKKQRPSNLALLGEFLDCSCISLVFFVTAAPL